MARGGARPGAGRRKGAPNKATVVVRDAAQAFTEDALSTLASIMRDDAQPAAARVAAANALLDRGHGKPKQSLDIDARVTTPKTLNDFYGGDA
ncbi:hypothetical protein ACLBV5_04465 [Brevundimonas sp. M1A4_2e]